MEEKLDDELSCCDDEKFASPEKIAPSNLAPTPKHELRKLEPLPKYEKINFAESLNFVFSKLQKPKKTQNVKFIPDWNLEFLKSEALENIELLKLQRLSKSQSMK